VVGLWLCCANSTNPQPKNCLKLRVRRPMHAIAVFFVMMFVHTLAFAGPRIEPLPFKQATLESGCRFLVNAVHDGTPLIVLEWVGQTASIQVDGRLLTMNVKEQQCSRNCVAPGKTGSRVIHFVSGRVRATLRVHAFCPKDAEVCSGLFAGSGHLTVFEGGRHTSLSVWNEACDQ
jgi:hypothetical protein